MSLVGWSEDQQYPTCFIADEIGRYGEPFTSREVGGYLMPYEAGTGPLAGRNLLDMNEPLDLRTDPVALIAAQSAWPDAGVGAFAQLTTIRRDRIETRIVKWFEDQSALAQKPELTGSQALFSDVAGT